MENILHYFPELTPVQISQFQQLFPLYNDWNQKINVISRKDMDNFYNNHVLHSLFIAKVVSFVPGTRILDVGTGGGFPGIPLAIMFPQCKFTLVDSIGKKIKVVQEIAKTIQLTNISASQQRAEMVADKFDFIVSRAVTALPVFLGWIDKKISPRQQNEIPNGILYLKGGDLTAELTNQSFHYNISNLSDHFKEEFFKTKKLVHAFK